MQREFILLVLVLIINIGILVILVLHKRANVSLDFNPLLETIDNKQRKLEEGIRTEIAKNREELNVGSKLLREEVMSSLKILNDTISGNMRDMANFQKNQLDSFSDNSAKLIRINEEKIDSMKTSVDDNLKSFSNSVITRMMEMSNLQNNQFEGMRKTLEERLRFLQEDNSKKLEQMRATVDEKLHETLERRLGESFKLVSDKLDMVGQGLGEMKVLATGVGDLKNVLTNIKTRGTWGEIQLGNLLDQILTPEQYERNVATKKGSRENVEFALKLPGKKDQVVWLPIDAKFPKEDYERLVSAQDAANTVLVDEALKALEIRIKHEAKDIRDKYIDPPNTTDFGILFLSAEGLYAEVLRIPGLCEILQRKFRVIVAGPTTLAALLNSLQMGFKTLAIEKRASEVWNLLGAVKTEFGKFGGLLEKTHQQIMKVGDTIDIASRKSRTIERKLRDVQVLPAKESARLIEALPEREEENNE